MAGPINTSKAVPAIVELEEISRTRSLTSSEERRLYMAIRRSRHDCGERSTRPWTYRDECQLRRLLLSGKRPAEICIVVRRTERAIWRRMCILGWTVRMAKQGSIPHPRRTVGE